MFQRQAWKNQRPRIYTPACERCAPGGNMFHGVHPFFHAAQGILYNTLTFGSHTAFFNCIFCPFGCKLQPKIGCTQRDKFEILCEHTSVQSLQFELNGFLKFLSSQENFTSNSSSVAALPIPRHFGASQIVVARPNILKIMFHMHNLRANPMLFSEASELSPKLRNGFR